MGWDFTHRAKGQSNLDYFTTGAWPVIDTTKRTILEHATVEHVFYAAVRDHDTGEVWALVVPTQWVPNAEYNFGYSTQTETVGPGVYKAPLRLLDALTPTDDEWANEWRQGCREYQARRAWVRTNVRPGVTVTFPTALTFRSSRFPGMTSTETTLTYQVVQGRSVLVDGSGTRCVVPKWRDLIVVPPEATAIDTAPAATLIAP